MAKSTAFEVASTDPSVVKTIYCSDSPDAKQISQKPWFIWSNTITYDVREIKRGMIQIDFGSTEHADDPTNEAERFKALNAMIMFIMGHGFAV